ncbi:uncharacterized protein C12orf76 homolog [Tiliqua scincoides]|uniref:uncharacterized protein C12orf76 homolog n=1 Tax=Tiliqua scincoides TaxID=71010 RepID=UPI0034634D94
MLPLRGCCAGRRRMRLPLLLLLRAALAQAGEASRPYAVLRGQNLVLLGTVFGVLLVALILMAVCVYKPVSRR